MPSIEVNRSGLSKLDQNGSVESSKSSKDHKNSPKFKLCVGEHDKINPESQAKMPCNPYGKVDAAIVESPPTDRRNSPLPKNGITHTDNSLECKTKMKESDMAPDWTEKQPLKNEESQRPKQVEKEQQSKTRKDKPRSFSLLEMTYKAKGENDRGRLVRQRSVKNSFEKETHVLTHAASAPAAISNDLEARQEDDVFEKINEEEETKVKNVSFEESSESREEDEASHEGIVEGEERRDEGIVIKPKNEETSLGRDEEEKLEKIKNEKSEDIKDDEVIPEIKKEKLDGDESESSKEVGKDETEDAGKAEGEQTTPETSKMDEADVDSLTDELQTTLKIKDACHKDVDSLAKSLGQGLSIQDKITMEPKSGVDSGRLRARGLRHEDANRRPQVIMTTDNAFRQQQYLSRPPNTASWQFQQSVHQQSVHQQQGQSLPSIPIFLRPQPKPSSQPYQSVVSPPGQGNHSHMVYNMSMQSQLAQQNLYFEQPPCQMQQNFLQNKFGSSFQQPIPQQSTGSPSEVDWPPTPEHQTTDINMTSVDSDDLFSSIQDCTQINDIGSINSPQSPWGGSYTSSLASVSPRPDVSGPWSPPDSSLGSPGEPLSPETSTFIKSPRTMTSGMVTVSSVPHSPPKRQRNDSTRSTDSQEASERIDTIKKYLKEKPDASPIHMGYSGYPINQHQQSYSPSHTPPYNAQTPHYNAQTPPYNAQTPPYNAQTPPYNAQTPPYNAQTPPYNAQTSPYNAPTPSQTPPQTQGYTPQPSPCIYPRPETPPEGELEAFRKHLEKWSIEDLVAVDDDRDTVLHLAIVQLKVALSSAIIERIYYNKQTDGLNIRNKLLQTPLYMSVISNIPALTEILINYGADLTLGNRDGDTPLHAAAIHGNYSAVEAICSGIFTRGYTEECACRLFNTNNYEGKTPLMLAVENHGNASPDGLIIDCQETVKRLLTSRYASALWQDTKSGKTALHYAVELRKYDLICLLLEYSEDAMGLVNSQMYNGNTALHLIVGRDMPEKDILVFVNLLMNHGANVGIENAEKEKPFDLVQQKNLEIRRRLHGQGKVKK